MERKKGGYIEDVHAGWTKEPDGTLVFREDPEDVDSIILHPIGTLEISQNVVPLRFEMEKFGGSESPGQTRYDITDIMSGGAALDYTLAKEYYIPASLKKLEDKEKLSASSFAKKEAGVRISWQFILVNNTWLLFDVFCHSGVDY